MSSNGGTLHGVIPPSSSTIQQQHIQQQHQINGNHTCSQCGLLFDSGASLQVHMHYHHEQMNRWGVTSSSSTTITTTAVSSSSSSTTAGAAASAATGAASSPTSTAATSSVLSSTTSTPPAAGSTTPIGGGNHSSSGGSGGGGLLPQLPITTTSGIASVGSNSPTDSENNNQPPVKHLQQQQQTQNQQQHHIQASGIKTEQSSPTFNNNNSHSNNTSTNSTVSAPADSSDNQPPTPQPSSLSVGDPGTPLSYSANSPYQTLGQQQQQQQQQHHHQQEMHPFPSYMHSYDQYYHPPPNMDYGQPPQGSIYGSSQGPPPPSLTSSASSHQEYKLVPSPRYHPYLNNSSHHHHQQQPQHQQHHPHQQQHHQNSSSGTTGSSNSTTSTVPNSSLSPRVVSSSSPTQNAMIGQTPQESAQMPPPPSSTSSQGTGGVGGQPTPSPSPKQCDKCGLVCDTHAQLSDHYNTAHHGQPPSNDSLNRSGSVEETDIQGHYVYQPYIKEEPASDILDLDSQKMVYPTHDPSNQDALPPMHSMHPMHRPLMWGAATDMHSGYMSHPHAQPDLKQSYYSPLKQGYPSIKQEYIAMKQEYGTGPTGFVGSQMMKNDFNAHQQLAQPSPRDLKGFASDLTSVGGVGPGNAGGISGNVVVNPVSSSPSEFPSTTTPQENGPQFRGFEPPTSSLSSNTGSSKSATWKSNEARRPKTYNCTACNKWFTSSGHLKRHYNTTLHKNAVKSSGQPDPATLPISAHHHPSRDPNSKHHHRNNQAQQPPPAPPEPPRSPEYTPQYTPPPSGGFSQPPPQGFQQYTTSIHTNANGHPNGQAGPSVHASQPRGLLIYSTMEHISSLDQEEQDHHHQHLQSQQSLQQLQQLDQHQQHQMQEGDLYNHQVLEHHQQQQPPLQPLQQQQLSPDNQGQIHIISMPHHHHPQEVESPTTTHSPTTTTTTIISTMDQRYIITPITINTNSTIPSYHQHMQLPEEHQQNYHTIIGNDSQIANNDSDDSLLQLGNASTISPTSPFDIDPQTSLNTNFLLQNGHHQHMQTASAISPTTPSGHHQQAVITTTTALVPSIAALRRLTGGVAAFQGDTAPPFSPDVPETYHLQQNSTITNHRTTSPTPQMSAATEPHSPAPCSPSISSTVSGGSVCGLLSLGHDHNAIKSLSASPMLPVGGGLPPFGTQPTQNGIVTLNKGGAAKGKRQQKTAAATRNSASATVSDPSQPPPEHRCIQCDKVFNKACYLTQHNKTFHSGEKPFKCQRCGKRFPCDVSHEEHLAKHVGNKPFKCNLCPKQFNHKTDLRRHMCLHSGTKPYACDVCGKGFIRKDHMVKHGETHRRKVVTNNKKNNLAATQSLIPASS